jgi:hypothetical protein
MERQEAVAHFRILQPKQPERWIRQEKAVDVVDAPLPKIG